MNPEIRYIEQKSGFSDNGPAWIALAEFSKTGNTIYFNGSAFKKYNGISGNYIEVETGDEYWISGIKKDMTDRHWAGGGYIFVETRILDEYLRIINKPSLDKTKYKTVEVTTSGPVKRIHAMENEIDIAEFDNLLIHRPANELSNDQLNYAIRYLTKEEKTSRFNKGRRAWKEFRKNFEAELEKRELVNQ